jgi:hypothetical protein
MSSHPPTGSPKIAPSPDPACDLADAVAGGRDAQPTAPFRIDANVGERNRRRSQKLAVGAANHGKRIKHICFVLHRNHLSRPGPQTPQTSMPKMF